MKKAAFLLWIAAALLALSGCRVIRIEEAERTPLKYTVVDSARIPEEAAALIEEKKAAEAAKPVEAPKPAPKPNLKKAGKRRAAK